MTGRVRLNVQLHTKSQPNKDMKSTKCANGTNLNNNTPSATSEGLKTQTGEQLQAQPLQEKTIPNLGTSVVTLRFPKSPDDSDEFYWTDDVNSYQHKIRQLLCFKSLLGIDMSPTYFDLVKNLETGELRIRLDLGCSWVPCWQNLESLDCESISAAILALMADNYLNAIMLNEHCVVNCAPDILSKTHVAKIIDAGLQNAALATFITHSEFMDKRYVEYTDVISNDHIYNRD